MAALPSNLSYCKVTGTFIRAVVDSPDDPDQNPDALGRDDLSVTFSADLIPALVRDAGAVPPVVITLDPIAVRTNAAGTIISPDGTEGVFVVATDDPDTDPTGWTYRCDVRTLDGIRLFSFSFAAPSGGTVDLSSVIPVPANPGQAVIEWQAAVLAAQAAEAGAIAAAGSAAEAAEAAEAAAAEIVVAVGQAESWTGAVSLADSALHGSYLLRKLTGATVLTMPAGVAGLAYSSTLEVAQDATGGRTLAIKTGVASYGVPVPLSTAANAVDVLRLEWNGSRWAVFLAGADLRVPAGWA